MIKHRSPLIVLIALLALTGCWDARDVEQRSLVMGVAFDLAEDNDDHIMTIEIPVITSYASENGGGEGDKTITLSTTGDNVAHMTINFESRVWRELSFGHTQVLIIGEDLARKGIQPFLDFFDRNPRIDRRMKLIIAQEEARSIFNSDNPREPIVSLYLNQVLERTPTTRVITRNFQDSLRKLEHNGDTILPRVRSEDIEVTVAGSALIKDYKLQAWLGENETRAAGFLYNTISDGGIYANVDNVIYTLVLRTAKTRIKPRLDGDQLSFDISIKGDGDIFEVFNPTIEGSIDIPIQKVEAKVNQIITDEIKHLINMIQEYEADPFQFGQLVYQKYPKYWREYGTNWKREVFPQVDFEIETQFTIRRQGIIN